MTVVALISVVSAAVSPPPITFEHSRRVVGEQPTVVNVTSMDKKIVLKLQSNEMVRLIDAESDKPVGPDIRLV